MSTGTQPVLDIENTGAKASPDWIQSTTTNTDLGNRKDEQPEDSLVELKYRSVENVAAAKFAKGLGLFSIALGLAEVLASRQLGELAGLNEKHSSYLPLLGAREIAHGLGILKSTKPTAGVWTRVGGDAIDLAFLGNAFANETTNKSRLAVALAAVAGVTALDLICAKKLAKPWTEADGNPLAPTTVGQPSARQSMTA
jgi:hypothetical protein